MLDLKPYIAEFAPRVPTRQPGVGDGADVRVLVSYSSTKSIMATNSTIPPAASQPSAVTIAERR